MIAQMPGSYPKSLGPDYSKVAVGGEEKKEKREVVGKAPQRPFPVADPGGRRCGKGGSSPLVARGGGGDGGYGGEGGWRERRSGMSGESWWIWRRE